MNLEDKHKTIFLHTGMSKSANKAHEELDKEANKRGFECWWDWYKEEKKELDYSDLESYKLCLKVSKKYKSK